MEGACPKPVGDYEVIERNRRHVEKFKTTGIDYRSTVNLPEVNNVESGKVNLENVFKRMIKDITKDMTKDMAKDYIRFRLAIGRVICTN